MQQLITPHRKQREEIHNKVRAMYQKLIANPENMPTAVEAKVMAKYGIKSRTTIWRIVRKEPPV